MPYSQFKKPKLPPHILVRYEPPDSSGEEGLTFRSEQRRVVLKGSSFRELKQRVFPLLDGRHTLREIEDEVVDVFRPEDLREGLQLLADNNLLQEGAPPGTDDRAPEDRNPGGNGEPAGPQLSYFHELGEDPYSLQEALFRKTVAIVGLNALGTTAARALASAGVGTLRCADPLPVTLADSYLSAGSLASDQVGRARGEVVAEQLEALGTTVDLRSEAIDSDEAAAGLIEGADFVLCTLDPGLSKQIFKLNRACLTAGIRWTSARVSAFEGVLGPTVTPWETACYLCYQMRAVACAEDPEVEFEYVKYLDRRRRDDGDHRENLVFGTGMVGHLLGLEVFHVLLGKPSAASGSIVVFDLLNLNSSRHVVLRKPWCPACSPPDDPATGEAGA